jgi:hypothetical protein
MGIKEKYQELSKKHKLPSFDEIDNEFEISTIEKDDFLLREVRRKIAEKIEVYAKFLEEILQPEVTVCNMYESKAFDAKEREGLFKLYKKLMFLSRASVETAVNEDDNKTSEYINEVFKDWNQIKEDFLKFAKKSKECWLKESDIKEDLGYLG